MADLLMAVGRHGTGPALAIFISSIAAAQWLEERHSIESNDPGAHQ